MKFLIFLIFSIICFDVLSKPISTHCSQELSRYFSDPVNNEKAKEFIRLKTEITFHRMAHALFYNDRGKVGMRADLAVISAIRKMSDNEKADPEFQRAKASFEKYPLSRREFANILPYVQDVLNENMNLVGEAKQLFAIDESDIKLLHMLGEIEGNGEVPKFKYQSGDRSKSASVLNFPARIKALLKNRSSSVFFQGRLENKLKESVQAVDSFLHNLPVDPTCFSTCTTTNDSDAVSNLLDFATSLLGRNKFDKTKWGDVWLHIGGNKRSTSVRRVTRQRIPPVESITTEEVDTQVLSILSDKIIDRYDYFFEKEDLMKDPELVFSVARAMDQGSNRFTYQGRHHRLPSIRTTDSHSTAVDLILEDNYFTLPGEESYYRNIADKDSVREKAITETDIGEKYLSIVTNNTPSCAQVADGTFDPSLSRMLALALIQYKRKNDTAIRENRRLPDGRIDYTHSFVFNNMQCDASTGKMLPKSLEGFLFRPGGESEEVVNTQLSEEQNLAIQSALENGMSAYILNGEVYHLSGAKVSGRTIVSDPELNARMIQAETSSIKVVSNGEDIYKLTNGNWIKVTTSDQQDRINEFLTYKAARTPSFNQGPEFVASWYSSIELGKNRFDFNGQSYLTDTGEVAQRMSYADVSQLRVERASVRSSSDEDTIVHFHKTNPSSDCNYFTIVDKKQNLIKVYNNDGVIVWQQEVLTGKTKSDERIKWTDYSRHRTNNTTPAGIFTLGYRKSSVNYSDYYQNNYEGNLIDLIPEQGSTGAATNPFALHQIPTHLPSRYQKLDDGNSSNNRLSGGCVNLPQDKMIYYIETFHKKDCPFYVLPETDLFEFNIHGDSLMFEAKDRDEICEETSTNGCSNNYILSPSGSAVTEREIAAPIVISWDAKVFEGIDLEIHHTYNPLTPISVPLTSFSRSLQRNKQNIMESKNLSNAEYDELARIALGVMGIESEFCLNNKYLIKETTGVQPAISLVKGVTNASSEGGNSRGCTQIKQIERFLPPGRSITQDDLSSPEISAEATMYVLADLLVELKEKKSRGLIDAEIVFPSDDSGETNISDFIYYLYNGQHGQLESGTATPRDSARVRRMQEYMKYFRIRPR